MRTLSPHILRARLPRCPLIQSRGLRIRTQFIGARFNSYREPSVPPLPDATEKPFYVTSPIFYVNAPPHVGHLYSILLADVLKRWQKLKGRRAVFSTGTDEHGMKVQQAAAAAGVAPEKFVQAGSNAYITLALEGNCIYDTFLRTSSPEHHRAVRTFWKKLRERGYIYEGKHEGWYSVSDEAFVPKSQVTAKIDPATWEEVKDANGSPIMVTKDTGKVVEWTSEINYHFRLSKLQDKLLEFYKANPGWVVPKTRYKDIVKQVQDGLEDLSISRPRSRLTWGIPVPDDDSQTVYVWLDALVNYLTASGYPWAIGLENTSGWPADVHVIGKDITKFHCIYWPAFLLALDYPLPKRILTHAHWTINNKKMAKSEGEVVNPFHVINRFGVDLIRYYLLRDGGIQDDGDYSNDWVSERYKKELKNGFGNLANRVAGGRMMLKYAVYDAHRTGLSADPEAGGWSYDGHDVMLMDACHSAAADVDRKMEALDVPGALRHIISLMTKGNQYLTLTTPWALKDEDQKPEKKRRVFICAEVIRICSILLQPFVPEGGKLLLDNLSVAPERRTFADAAFAADKTYGENAVAGKPFPPLSEIVNARRDEIRLRQAQSLLEERRYLDSRKARIVIDKKGGLTADAEDQKSSPATTDEQSGEGSGSSKDQKDESYEAVFQEIQDYLNKS